MSKYVIEKNDGNKYEVNSLSDFCKEVGITERLLRYTNPLLKGKKGRYQEWHKGYRMLSSEEIEKWKKEKEVEIEERVLAGTDYITKEYKRLKKTVQRLRDENTALRAIERREFRAEEEMRSWKENINELIRGSRENVWMDFAETEREEEKLLGREGKKNVGFLVLSDWHIGKTVGLDGNRFDFEEARKRLTRLSVNVCKYLKLYNISTLHIALLGDFIHAQHRRDMKSAAQFVEIEAGVYCYHLIREFIESFRFALNDIVISGVVGNESRFDSREFHTNINSEAKNSIDYMIYEMLKTNFELIPEVTFNINGSNLFENVLKINENFNILAIHGDKINQSNIDNEISKLKLKVFNERREYIDYVVLGHIHSTLITDKYARNASLVGADEYASRGLNIPESYVSQLFGVVCDKDIHVFSIRLDK
jgi:hypothetical protein|nr:MAG TPA: DNA polymerase II small subunit [Caudoviricetes sp.]